MYLAADIGGTKTHVAIYDRDENYKPLHDHAFPSQDYQDLRSILKEFLKDKDIKIEKICLGIAGPVKNQVCKTTNLPWVVDAKEIMKDLGVNKVMLINDLEANAYGIRTLSEQDFFSINNKEVVEGNQALISAGTGLGEAGIFYHEGKYIPFPSEGGHCDFAPRNHLEIELLDYLIKKYGPHISYERLLSGEGIFEIFSFFYDTKKETPNQEVLDQIKIKHPPIVISEFGNKELCLACKRTLELFCSIYGSEAGNSALKFMAIGGIYIGGGIAPKILPILKKSDFFPAFINKGRMENLLKQIPIKVILKEDTALRGAAYYCKKVF